MTDVGQSVKDAVAATIKETGFQTSEDVRVADAAAPTTEDAGRPRNADGTFKTAAETAAGGEGGGEGAATTEGEEGDDKDKGGEGAEGDDKGKETSPTVASVTEKIEDGEDFTPSAEELELINKSPELRKAYRSMFRAFTMKSEGLATKRKEAETALTVVESLQKNPLQTIRALAAAAGLKIEDPPADKGKEKETNAEVEKTVVQKLQERLEAKIGKEGAEVLAPVLLEAIGAVTEERLAPIQKVLKDQTEADNLKTLQSGIKDFGAQILEQGGEWNKEIEAEMSKKVGAVLPGEGMTLPEYLEILHDNVITQRTKKATKVREVERIQEAGKKKEPRIPTRPTAPPAPSITAGMDVKAATALAVAQARQEDEAR